ncbi:MAG TPA: hypothetical protein VGF24_01280 [Vicinamibacterales bacterium]
MLSIAIAMLLAQASGCAGRGATLLSSAQAHAEAFDLSQAAADFDAAAMAGCTDAEVSALYLRGWIASRDAYRFGGSPESLAPVQSMLERMDGEPWRSRGDVEVARFVLRAAIAAAQSERDEMSLLIEHAVDLESRRRSASLPGAPIITAHEAAGDLWLQVHRYDDARRAYLRAAERIGRTRRVILGLARTAVRVSDSATACDEYAALAASWRSGGVEPSEIAEARTFLRQPSCATPRQPH